MEQNQPSPWQVDAHPSGKYWLVSRWYPQGGHDLLRLSTKPSSFAPRVSRFRSAEAAERAATMANIIDCYQTAMRVAPDAADGNADYYTKQLVRELGMTEKASRAAIAAA